MQSIDIIVKNINNLFHESRMTQQEFGERVGLKQSAISRLLKGSFDNPQLATLEAIAKAFGKTTAWLLTDHSENDMSGPASQVVKLIKKMSSKLDALEGQVAELKESKDSLSQSLIEDKPILVHGDRDDTRAELLRFLEIASDGDVHAIMDIVRGLIGQIGDNSKTSTPSKG